MAYCPNCQAELRADARACTSCGAVFTPDGWGPLANQGDPPTVAEPAVTSRGRIASGVARTIGAVVSLAFVGWGALWAAHNKSTAWSLSAYAVGMAVIGVALFARARWMLLVLLGTFIFGFASCTANFRWAGG